MYNGMVHPFGRAGYGGRRLGRMLRGIARRRMPRPVRYGRGCCCCPLVLVLGLASLGLIGGGFYMGMRLLGWA